MDRRPGRGTGLALPCIADTSQTLRPTSPGAFKGPAGKLLFRSHGDKDPAFAAATQTDLNLPQLLQL